MALVLDDILDEVIDDRFKGFPAGAKAIPLRDMGAQRWNVLRGDMSFPLAVLKASALAHNANWMHAYTQATGVLLAPHGKTTMCPQIFARQIADGGWGITVATVQQLGICVRAGVRRILMANQLVGRRDVAQVVALRNRHRDLEFHFLVDSIAQLELVATEVARHRPQRPLTVLLELGYPGGRTGVRTSAEALALARAIAGSTSTLLVGVECYEGLMLTSNASEDAQRVGAFMQALKEIALACDGEGLFAGDTIVLSAGGSAAFDIVARELPTKLSRPVETILRSGCYVTHDSGVYERMFEAIKVRSGEPWRTCAGLQPALEVWSQVQSRPERALAILTMGRRDVSYDIEMPRPLAWHRPGAGSLPQAAPSEWRITKLNDQHAYLELPAAAELRVGDLVGCGISHPCTTFDKWQLLMEVDDSYDVVGGLRTYF